MYGFFLAMLLFKAVESRVVNTFLKSILIFVGYSLFSGFKGGIDNAAHFGGFLAGFILGLSQIPYKENHWWQTWKARSFAMFSAVLILVGAGVYQSVLVKI